MGNAMRITKSLMRSTKNQLNEKIKELFAMSDNEIVDYIRETWVNYVHDDSEQNLKVALLLTVEKLFPDHMTL